MKKIIFLLIILSFLIAGCKVLAQESLPNPGTLPDSPFYFLEKISEDIGIFFTFGDLKKAERYAAFAAERLAEAQSVVEKGKPEFAEKTLERYEMQLEKSIARAEKAQSKGENTEKIMEVMTRVGQATSKHLEVLAEVYEKVPEQAKPAIEKAMVASVKGHEKAVEVLKTKGALGEVPEKVSLPAEVPEEARERIQMKVQQELEIEKALQGSESPRDFCIKVGGPSEICEKAPLQGFKSFESLKAFCIEAGGPSEICTSVEAKCKEAGVTTPDKCFRGLFISGVKASPASPLSEEEMEEKRRREEEKTTTSNEPQNATYCEINEMIFYYSDTCGPCQKIKDDGIIERIERLGVKVNQIDITIGPINHQIQGVPTFVVDKKVYIGYKTLNELKELLGCQ